MMDFQAAKYLQKGEIPVQVGNDHPTSMPTSCYECLDGYINVAATGQVMWLALCDAIGKPELKNDPRFITEPLRVKNRDDLNKILIDIFKVKEKSYWVDLLNQVGVPTGPIYDLSEVFKDPQVISQNMVAEVNHPKLGNLKLVNQALKLTRTPAEVKSATPELGEHTKDILKELKYSEEEISEFVVHKVV